MAVSYQQAEQNRQQKFDNLIVAEIEKIIDEQLMDPGWFDQWKCGTSKEPFWRFGYGKHVSRYVIDELIRKYTEAGWAFVTAENMDYPNPAENCLCIKLYGKLSCDTTKEGKDPLQAEEAKTAVENTQVHDRSHMDSLGDRG